MTAVHHHTRAIKRVGVVAKSGLQEAAGTLVELSEWLNARSLTGVFETETATLSSLTNQVTTCSRDEMPAAVDMILVLGGDGTLLAMGDRIAQHGVDVPLLGVNFGSLGFLTEITLAELFPALENAINGSVSLDQRRMLRAVVRRDEQVIADRVALNDVTLTRNATSPIIDLSVSVGSQFVAEFKADGLIVASPTGSTAYNLAAGGPIVHPVVEALVITPIAPHTLTNRPIIVPASSDIRIQPISNCDDNQIIVSFDGQSGVPLACDDIVSVSSSEQPLQLFRATSRSYFAVLREKLKWAER
ncbi:MAG: NAD(+)/NADH kinase [Vicinamibacterales bacterium]|nr:NAD(+) kinase [Acidobacteriota bacterium]MDP7210973.1 NAD(+)/NADH kinase [Vicinamibacterales bacterium]HJO18688.1 NAD(+)/NADH kinase [Vicinamibacterales bacterium]